MLLWFSVCAPTERQQQGLDERMMLAAMFAAGSRPLIHVPPALCMAPTVLPRFEQAEMRALLQDLR
jgi:hypothetical protein